LGEVTNKELKKTLYTLNIDGYCPEITELTYPLLKHYASKIGADFHVISKRKFPKFVPPVYEKLQIHDLIKERGDDWAIYVDSDALIHPDFFDLTEHIGMETVLHHGADFANLRWKYDDYFRRDRRNIGSCNWFTVASRWCRDLWHPLDDLSFEEAYENIFPIQNEINTVITRDHLIDDYVLSRNIAKYGLRFNTVIKLLKSLNDDGNYFWHQYTMTTKEKVEKIKEVLTGWGINGKQHIYVR
jgi:hypothetical protein